MENNFEQYETLLGSASEVAEACLDMEGGAFLLAWAGELIQDLVAEGYCRSARLTTQKLCKAVGVDWAWPECDELGPVEKQAWLSLHHIQENEGMDARSVKCRNKGKTPP